MSKDKILTYIFIVCFLLIVFGGMIGTIFLEKNEISSLENRTLAVFPEFSFEKIKSREYLNSIEEYLGDHIIFRDNFIKYYTNIQIILGKKEVNNITITEDSLLLPALPNEIPNSKLRESANSLITFTKKSKSQVILYFLPHKKNALNDLYGNSYNYKLRYSNGVHNLEDEIKSLLQDFPVINLNDEWNKEYSLQEKKAFYFKTDHHWNSEGAYAGYSSIVDNLKKQVTYNIGESYKKSDLNYECYDNINFKGSYHRQLYYLGNISEGSVCRYIVPENNFTTFTHYSGELKPTKKSYGSTFFRNFNEVDSIDYGNLFSLNYGLLKFTNENAPNSSKVLIIKDSYSNPLIPLMTKHFNTLYVIDPRYYKGESLFQFVEENNIDTTLLFYNDTVLYGPFYEFGTP